jgi:hypothetical protein
MDSAAPEWFDALLADEDFNHLRKSTRFYKPSAETIAAFEGGPAEAWRPLERHLDLTMDHGLAVLVAAGLT